MKKKLLSIGLALTTMFGWQTLNAQSAIDLSGPSDEVQSNFNFDVTNGFTLEYKVYMNVMQNFNAGITKGSGNQAGPIDIYVPGDGSMVVFIGNGGSTGSGGLPIGTLVANQWYHVAVTASSGGVCEVFVNGVSMTTFTFGALGNTTNPLIIGDRIDNATNSNALYDNVRVWSGIRTATEIFNNKDVCLTGSETGLELLYQMEEGAGTTLNDLALADGAQNGTVVNGGWGPGMACLGTCPIADETVTLVDYSALCFSDTTIQISSTTGVNYYLRDNSTNTIIDGPVLGTGGQIILYTGAVTSTTMFNVYAEVNEAGAITFDGADDYVSCGNILPASYTKEAWVYFSSPSFNNNIISGSLANGQHAFWAPPSYGSRLSSGHNNVWDEVQDPTPITFNTWHHVAVTYDNTTGEMVLYKNGVLVDSKMGVPAFTSGNLTELGRFNGGNYMQGKMDEARVWSTVRTQSEIQNSMDTCLIGTETGLVAYYKLNETSGTIASDQSPNGNNGTLINMNLATSWTVDDANVNCPTCTQQMTQTPTITINPIADQTFNTVDFSAICSIDTTIEISFSFFFVSYFLRDNANDSIIEGPIFGTGTSILFNTGSISTSMSYNLQGTVQGNNNSLNFDGVDDNVLIGDVTDLSFDNTSSFTIESWAKWFPNGAHSAIVSKMDNSNPNPRGYNVLITPSGQLYVQLFSDWSAGNKIEIVSTGTPFSDNQFHHVAVVYDGTSSAAGLTVYVDGVAQALSTLTDALTGTLLNNTPFVIGDRAGAPGHSMSGTLDEIRIWNTTRTQSEIANTMSSCLVGNEAGLIAYYRMEQVTGTFIIDATGNSNNGTMTNMDPLTDWIAGVPTLICTSCVTNFSQTTTITINPIADQTFNTVDFSAICSAADTVIEIASSEIGAIYFLRDNTNDSIIDGPIAGTGSPIQFTTGPISNTTTYNVNVMGSSKALSFDGVDDKVIIGNVTELSFDNTSTYTIESWVKWISNGFYSPVVAKMENALPYTGYNVLITPSGQVLVQIINDWGTANAIEVTTSGTVLADNQFHHVAVVYDGSSSANGVSVYIDGQVQALVISINGLTGTALNSTPFIIGNRFGTGMTSMSGSIDELRIWNTTRTPMEISNLMDSCLIGNEIGLVAHYKMEDAVGNSIIDGTANGNNGTLTNMNLLGAWTTGTPGLFCSSCDLQLSATPTITINPIADQTVAITDTTVCMTNTGTTVTTASSEVGVDYYLKDNANDTIIDGPISGTGSGLTFNTGVLAGNMTYNVEGTVMNTIPSALAFDGTNKSLFVADAPGLVSTTGQFTAEIWGRSNTATWNNFGLLMSKRSSYFMHTQAGSTGVTFYLTTDGISAAVLYTGVTDITVWHHYAMSWDGASLFCYIDGIMVASAPCTGNMVPSTNPLEMGKDNIAGRYLDGDIDDARIWNTYRNSGEILANYNRVLTGSEAGLEMYLPMNEGGGFTAVDITGNGHDGTVLNIVDPTDWIMGPSFVECNTVMTITPSVTVHDILAPIADLVTLSDVTAECSVTTLTAPTATDNCATTVTVTNDATLPITTQGTTMVTWTYDDGNGNTSTQTQNVVIADVTNPTITAPGGISVLANGNGCIAGGVILGTATVSDNCSGTVTVTNDAFPIFMLGSTTVTWTATDSAGNQSTATQMVTVTSDLAVANDSVHNNLCNGDSTGEAFISVSGGTAGYTYAWDNSATTEDIMGLMAGAYNVTVTDMNGCTATSASTVTEPTAITATSTSTDVVCNGDANGTASLTFTGGTGTLVSGWGTADTTALAPGYAVYTVTDASSCVLMDSVLITEPSAMSLSATVTDEINGTDGTVDLTVTGGIPTYTFVWDNAATTEDLTGLTAGTYFVTVTDANGCTDTLSTIVASQVGISENGIEAKVYPNPTSGVITIEFAQMLDGTITVLDGIGKIVLTERITNIKQVIDLSNNERGIYFLRISKGDSSTMIKVVLQ